MTGFVAAAGCISHEFRDGFANIVEFHLKMGGTFVSIAIKLPHGS